MLPTRGRVELKLRPVVAGAICMLRQALVGFSVSVCNIAIHAFLMAAVIWAARVAAAIATSHRSFRLITVMIVTVSLLMAAHFAEVLVWSSAYAIVGAAPEGSDLIYFAFVNYTTLGYGDVIPMERWRLLGPMTAMNGVLLFGWSTAVIFEVLRRTLTMPQGRGT
jgi:ion channel